eukprot:6388779-Alexandrium_andersonii.AAC.1
MRTKHSSQRAHPGHTAPPRRGSKSANVGYRQALMQDTGGAVGQRFSCRPGHPDLHFSGRAW